MEVPCWLREQVNRLGQNSEWNNIDDRSELGNCNSNQWVGVGLQSRWRWWNRYPKDNSNELNQ